MEDLEKDTKGESEGDEGEGEEEEGGEPPYIDIIDDYKEHIQQQPIDTQGEMDLGDEEDDDTSEPPIGIPIS